MTAEASNHRIAWLTQRQGPEAHRRMLDKAANIVRTGENLDAVSLDEVSTLIAKREHSREVHVLVVQWIGGAGR